MGPVLCFWPTFSYFYINATFIFLGLNLSFFFFYMMCLSDFIISKFCRRVVRMALFLSHSHTVRLGQTTHGSIFGEEAVFQVNHGLSDLLVSGQHVMIIEHHLQVFLQREGAGEFKHPDKDNITVNRSLRTSCEERFTLEQSLRIL